MYSITKTSYGFKLTFGGFIDHNEMQKWVGESRTALQNIPSKFGVVIDMRTLKPLPSDAQAFMVEGQQAYKKAGMVRSAVVLQEAVTTMQFKRLAKESGIYAWERYISSKDNPAWEKAATDWVENEIDPDKN